MKGSVPTVAEQKGDEAHYDSADVQILKTRLGQTSQPSHRLLSTWTLSYLGSG